MSKKSIYLLIAFMLLAGGCYSDNEKKLVGRWQETGNPKGRLEFNSDHSGLAFWPGDSGEQKSSPMKWQLLKGGNKVSVVTPPGPVDFELKADRLVAPNGVELTKVK